MEILLLSFALTLLTQALLDLERNWRPYLYGGY